MDDLNVIRGVEMKKTIKKPSAVPLYGTALVWLIYCLIFPLYRLSDILILIGAALIAYVALTKLFPGGTVEVEVPEEPVTTGDEETDALLRQGEDAVREMRELRDLIKNTEVRNRADEIIDLTDRIFKDIINDPSDIPQVRRFANYYLPTTMKLLKAYGEFESQNLDGDTVRGTLMSIESILDTTVEAFRKQLDALFANQALDIETDIKVLETMLKREGLSGKDF